MDVVIWASPHSWTMLSSHLSTHSLILSPALIATHTQERHHPQHHRCHPHPHLSRSTRKCATECALIWNHPSVHLWHPLDTLHSSQQEQTRSSATGHGTTLPRNSHAHASHTECLIAPSATNPTRLPFISSRVCVFPSFSSLILCII